MERKIWIILFILFYNVKSLLAQWDIPQLMVGQPISYILYHLSYPFTGYCDSIGVNYYTVTINSNLASAVTGVEFDLVVTGVPLTPDSAYTLQHGALHLGDTIKFTSLNNSFVLYSSAPGSVLFDFVIVGTPVIPHEQYPCNLVYGYNLVDCARNNTIEGINMLNCSVQDVVGVREENLQSIFKLSYNSEFGNLELSANSGLSNESILRVMDLSGKEVVEVYMPKNCMFYTINVSKLSHGIYVLIVSDNNGFKMSNKIFIE